MQGLGANMRSCGERSLLEVWRTQTHCCAEYGADCSLERVHAVWMAECRV